MSDYSPLKNSKAMSNKMENDPKIIQPQARQKKQSGLTPDKALAMWNLFVRKQQLEQQVLASPEKDRELARIRNILPQFFAQHGPELLHSHLVTLREYLPLRDALIPVVMQAQAMMERAAAQAAQHQAELQKESEEDDGLDNHDSDGAAPQQNKPEIDD